MSGRVLREQLSIRLTVDERSELEALAREQQRSLAFVARQGVRMLLGRDSAADTARLYQPSREQVKIEREVSAA